MNDLLKDVKKELKTQAEIANSPSSKEKPLHSPIVLPLRVIQLLEDAHEYIDNAELEKIRLEELEKIRLGEIEKEIDNLKRERRELQRSRDSDIPS